ncbi:MAG: septum site-determining protein MinC [Clostridiaceae bacterium]|nr:septum site-determining protein MinC [Clostridiaceae bacterium]
MEDNNNIVFKATNNGLILIMNESDDFEKIYGQVEKRLNAAGRFFKGSSLAVRYRGKKFTEDEEEKLRRLMEEKTEAEIKSFEEDKGYDVKIPDKNFEIEENDEPGQYFSSFYFRDIEEGITRFYKGTVRSGQLISFNGNVVILGDVNPGAEIQAAGNIIVLGYLRGIVHAGMDGNKEAVVVALNLQPVQLRIANIITRPPDGTENKGAIVPEIAYIKDDQVYIERLLPQR